MPICDLNGLNLWRTQAPKIHPLTSLPASVCSLRTVERKRKPSVSASSEPARGVFGAWIVSCWKNGWTSDRHTNKWVTSKRGNQKNWARESQCGGQSQSGNENFPFSPVTATKVCGGRDTPVTWASRAPPPLLGSLCHRGTCVTSCLFWFLMLPHWNVNSRWYRLFLETSASQLWPSVLPACVTNKWSVKVIKEK